MRILILSLIFLFGVTGASEAFAAKKRSTNSADRAVELYNMGTTLLGKSPEKAVILLEEALRLKPDFLQAHINLGNAYVKVGKNRQAEESNRKGLKLDPLDEIGLSQYGRLLVSEERYIDALKLTEICIKKDLGNCKFVHAHALDKTGEFLKAFEVYSTLLKKFSNDSDLHVSRCAVALRAKRDDLFDAAYNDWIKALPNDPRRQEIVKQAKSDR